MNWSSLQPVTMRIDASDLNRWRVAVSLWFPSIKAAVRRVLEWTGYEVDQIIDKNLSGGVLNERSGRLRSSWQSGMVDDLAWAGHSRIGYGALWEEGFTQKPGRFPVRAKFSGRGANRVTDADFDKGLPEGSFDKDPATKQWYLVAGSGKRIPIVWRWTKGGKRGPKRWAAPAARWAESVLSGRIADALAGRIKA